MSASRRAFLRVATALLAASLASASAAGGAAPQPERWSAQAVADARNAGKTVFVAFRADWCVICRLNEMTVFRAEDVRAALAGPDVAYLVADYTDKADPEIKKALDYYQGGALPMYLVFKTDQRRPLILQQMPGKSELIAALR